MDSSANSSTLLLPKLNKTVFYSYLWDWVSMVLVYGMTGLLDLIPPFRRYYFQSDTSIAYPLQAETVPTWLLGVLSWILPAFIILIVSLLYRKSSYDTHHALLALFLALGVTTLLTTIIKLSAGRLRPNFLARCAPADLELDNSPCTGSESIVNEGRKSFPSGHASAAFSGLGFLAIYLAGKFRLFDYKGHIWKYLLVLLPLIGAYLIAISRVDDYYHHWQDVTVGGLLGLSISYITYRQYYPSLWASGAGEPFKTRRAYKDAHVDIESPSPAKSSAQPSAEP